MGVKQGATRLVGGFGGRNTGNAGRYSSEAYDRRRVTVSRTINGTRSRATGRGTIASGNLGESRLNVRNMPNRG